MRRTTAILQSFSDHDVTISDFLISLFHHPLHEHPLVQDFLHALPDVLTSLLTEPTLHKTVMDWALATANRSHAKSVRQLSNAGHGWHFSASNTSVEQLKEFRMEDMVHNIKTLAPGLWRSIRSLLSANPKLMKRRSSAYITTEDPSSINPDADPEDEEDEREFWMDIDSSLGQRDNDSTINSMRPRSKTPQERQAILDLVRVCFRRLLQCSMTTSSIQKATCIISIMMQSTNQKCNILQSILGVFLHSCNTPQRVIQSLARMGTSISSATILRAIKSLSAETYETLRTMGQSLTVSYTYDNFDIDFKTSQPAVEKSAITLTHMTSGTLTYLEHRVCADDFKCSAALWDQSPLNPNNDVEDIPPSRTYFDFIKLHPEKPHPTGLTHRERFQVWVFLNDLCHHGPNYFAQFKPSIGLPEFIEKIPVVKMRHAPAKAMDINQSRVSGNIQVVQNLLDQGGIGDETEDSVDISDHVVIFNGDLATGERLESVLERRSIEDTPKLRFQLLIFVPGLFHLKMACADAIWRIFIKKKECRDDENSLMQFLAVHHVRDSGKIGSAPGFRRMHEVILQEGVALRLDAWRMEVCKRNPAWTSLNQFAESKPSYEDLTAIANDIVRDYIAGFRSADVDVFKLRQQPPAKRDAQRENILLLHRYLLLYEEITYAMNYGDIGQLESVLPPWIAIFKATGKHKYATSLSKFLSDLHWRYPGPLRRAIRYNILVNPTGKEGAFRALDWVQEFHNLQTKVRVPLSCEA